MELRHLNPKGLGPWAAHCWPDRGAVEGLEEGGCGPLRSPRRCGCRHRRATPRSSGRPVWPAWAVSSASLVAAPAAGTGACSPPLRPYRCTGAGSWAGSPRRAGRPGHPAHMDDPWPRLVGRMKNAWNYLGVSGIGFRCAFFGMFSHNSILEFYNSTAFNGQ